MEQHRSDISHNGVRISRRIFLRSAFVGSAGLLTLEMLGGFGFFFRPQNIGASGQTFRVGKVEDFAVGSVTHSQEGKFYLSRVPEGFLAMWQKCTHLGCTVPWVSREKSEDDISGQGRFNCPCHGSIYNRYGVVTAGPAPRPFDLFPVTIVDGAVIVDSDLNKVITRQAWDPSQAVKA
ncbi:MAG: Rieske 2Fe-2S domain-containing protein [Dehalococcoidia bacterium]|nr:Rieske 2Fe-2S domain-containing protein [Dehalococcoidia bacterium]